MYVLICLSLLTFVYILPGLAIFPTFIFSPKRAFAIPILSAFVVYILVTLLKALNSYTHTFALAGAGLLALIAVCRLIYYRSKGFVFSWQKQDLLMLLFNVCIMMPYFIKLGTEGFERDDEIYSWNFWAIQHLYQEPLDFYNTGATYPQLFPKLLSFCYQFLGSIQLQCPVKAMLGLFPLAMLCAWSSMLRPFTTQRWVIYIVGVLSVVAGLKLEQFFNDGYADPLMTSALVVSMALLIQATLLSHKQHSANITLIASVMCAGVACFTKQPAFMWCVFVLPLTLFYLHFKTKKESVGAVAYLPLAFASIGLALLWFFTEGQGFYNNHGVIFLSFKGRTWFEQIGFVLNQYGLQKPLLPVLLVLCGWLVRKHPVIRLLYWVFVIPQLILWFTFGSYQFRLGQHVVAVTTLLCFFCLRHTTWQDKRFGRISDGFARWSTSLLKATVVVSMLACGGLLYKAALITKPGIDLKDGGRVSLEMYFKQDAQKVYDEIYQNPENLVWVPSGYLYGIFYKHTKLTTPDYNPMSAYDRRALISELRSKQPDFIFAVGAEVVDGPASEILKEVVKACPNAFDLFASPPNKYQYFTYKVNKLTLNKDECLDRLSNEA